MSAYVTPQDQFNLFVTHVESTGNLLVVVGQRDRDAAVAIEQTICLYCSAFLEGKGAVTVRDISVGQLCCAAYEDDTFYRARVLGVDANTRRVTVLFLDYGNVENVPVSAIRSLEGFSGPIKETPPLASNYLLSRFWSNWTAQKLEFVSNRLKYEEFTCYLDGSVRTPLLIKIMYGGQDFAEYLANQGMGSYVPLQQYEGQIRPMYGGANNMQAPIPPNPMWQRIITTTGMVPGMNGSGPVMSNHVPPQGTAGMVAQRPVMNHMAPPPSQSGIRSASPRVAQPGLTSPPPVSQVPPVQPAPMAQSYIRMRQPQQQAMQYKSSVLEPGTHHRVFISHVEDGPVAFSVQLMASHPQLVSLMQDINNQTPEPITVPLHGGMMCLARFMEDMSLCRALVLFKTEEAGSGRCRVYYVDYGNTDDVSMTHIYAMPPKFAVPKVLSYRCALNGVDGAAVTSEEKKIFKDIVQGREVTLIVCAPDGTPNKHLGEIFLDGKDVKELMKEKVRKKSAVLRYPKVEMPQAGSKEVVVVSYVEESSKSFHVQLSKYSDSLNALMDSVHNHCTGGSGQVLHHDVKVPGMPCCAMYTDGCWYRAVILNCFGDDVIVMYVDFGNEAKVKSSELLNISPQLVSQLRVQAIPCKLEGSEIKENMSKLKELEGETLTMQVVVQKDAFVVVRLFDSEGNDVMRPPATLQSQITSPQTDGWSETAPSQQSSFNDRRKGRPFDKSKMSSPGEDSGFNEDQNWRKPGRPEYIANNQESSGGFGDKPKKQFGDGGGRFGDRDRSRGFGDDSKGFRGGDRSSDNGDKPARGGFGDRDGGRRGFSDRGDGDGHKPRGGFGDRDGGRRGFGDKGDGDGDKPRGGFGDRDGGRRGFGDRGDGDGDKTGGGRFGGGDRRGFGGDREEGGGRFGDRDRSRGGFRDRGEGGGRFGDRRGGDREEGGRFGGKGRYGDRGGSGSRFGDNKDGGYGGQVDTTESWDDGASAAPTVDAAPAFPFSHLDGTTEDVSFVFGHPTRFYLHRKPENPEFTTLGESISSTYSETNTSITASDVKTGLLCVAFSADYEGFYRARVENPIEGGAHVIFIDYGNAEDVFLDNMKVITDDLKTLPPQAIPCTLRGVPAKEWSEAEVADFAALAEVELRATFVELNDEVFSTVLIDTSAQETVNEKVGATPESLKPLAATFYVPDMTLESGFSAPAEVTWFVNPDKFYIQFQTSKGDLVNLMQSIQDNFKNLKPLKTCEPSWFVLARFKEDKVIYRAQVKNADGASDIGVEFIDYGNCDLVEKGSVFSMEADHVVLPRQGVRCRLDGVVAVGEAWPAAGTSDIDNCFMGELTCTVVRMDEDGAVRVSLDRGGIDVAAELIEKDLASPEVPAVAVPEEIDLDILPGQILSGRVTHVNADDRRIYVALEKSVTSQLDELLAQSTADPEALTVLTADYNVAGEWCLVSTSVSKYLRAEILDPACASGVLVKLIDVGSCEEVTPDKMYFLPDEVAMIPAQATEFKFDGSVEEGQEVVLKISSSDDGLSATLAEEDLCPLPILRKSAKVYVPFVNNTTLWIQLVSLGGNVAELLDKLFEAYDSLAEDSFSPSVGALCAAKSVSDEAWYRARVAETSDEGVTVSYVDYGNTEILPKENLRELSPDFKSHALARGMRLPISSPEDLSAELTELTGNAAFDAEFATKDGVWQIDLKQSDGSKLSKVLIDLGKATRSEDALFPEEFTAFLAHLESLSEIYLHDEKDCATLEALQAELQTLAESLEDGVEEGSVCLALFNEDEQWYRAEMLADGRARFIDYGNADKVDQVKKLPQDKIELKRFAIKCCLTAPEGREWTPEDAARATELLADGVLVKILEDGETKMVDLAVGGSDLKTLLVEDVPTDVAGEADGEQLSVEQVPVDECLEKVCDAEVKGEILVEPENHADGTTIDTKEPTEAPLTDVEEREISEPVHEEVAEIKISEVSNCVEYEILDQKEKTEAAYDEQPTQGEDAEVPEKTCKEELNYVADAGVLKAAAEECARIENAEVCEPTFEGSVEVETAEISEPTIEERVEVEIAEDCEPASEEGVKVEIIDVCESSSEECADVKFAEVCERSSIERAELEIIDVCESSSEEYADVEFAEVCEPASEERVEAETAEVCEPSSEERTELEIIDVCESSSEEGADVEFAEVCEPSSQERAELEIIDVCDSSSEECAEVEFAEVCEPSSEEGAELEIAEVCEPSSEEGAELEIAEVCEPSSKERAEVEIAEVCESSSEECAEVEFAEVCQSSSEEGAEVEIAEVDEPSSEERAEVEIADVCESSSEERAEVKIAEASDPQFRECVEVENADLFEPADEELVQVEGTKVPVPPFEEHAQSENVGIPEPTYEEEPTQIENTESACEDPHSQNERTETPETAHQEQLSQAKETTIPHEASSEVVDCHSEGLPDTPKCLKLKHLEETKDRDETAPTPQSPLSKDKARETFKKDTIDVSKKVSQNEACITEPGKPKDTLEVPFSQVEKEENSDLLLAKYTPLPQDDDEEDERLETVKDISFETKPEEKTETVEEVHRSSAIVQKVESFIQGDRADSAAQLSDCKRTKEETNGPPALDDLPESTSIPSESAGDYCLGSNSQPTEDNICTDLSVGAIKRVESLLSLTDELLAETSELVGPPVHETKLILKKNGTEPTAP